MHTTRKEMHTTRTAKESRSKLSKWHATVFTSNQGETHRDTQRHTETHRDTQRHTEDGCIGGGLDARVTWQTHTDTLNHGMGGGVEERVAVLM